MGFSVIFQYNYNAMLVITKSASARAARDYFDKSLRIGDYYREGERVAGVWHGAAAARLGLAGEVRRGQFCALVENRHPATREQLTPRQKADRVPGFDFTFTAPKSVSVLYALTGDERITEALRHAVREAMAEVEREMKTRVRAKGRNEDRVTGNMAWVEFLHHTARPIGGIPDPHLHIHAYAMNLTFDAVEKRWKAAQIGDIKGEAIYYEATFHAALAKRLAGLGYGIERHGRFFEIAGIDRDLIGRFSQRRDVVEAAAAAEGQADNPEAKRLLSRLTREKKADSLSIEELRDVWKARLYPRQRASLDAVVASARHGPAKGAAGDVRRLTALELGEALRSDSAVPEKAVLAAILQRGFGELTPAVARAGLDAAGVIRGSVGGRTWITTLSAHAQERRIVAFARDGRNTRAPLGAGSYRIATDWLNAQQRAAISHIWQSQDRVILLRGGAGVGKTTLMGEAVAGLAAGGHKCFVFASTVPATEVLKAEGFKAAQTIQKLIAAPTAQAEVGRNAAIWVDEAGLVDMATMEKLFALADANDWRLILSGDERQHTPVQRGDAMRLLKERAHLPVAEVSEIVRQRGAYKRAVQSIEGGLVDDGWKKLEAMGAIVEATGEARVDRLADDYLKALRAGDTVLVVAPTNRERQAVTEKIRDTLKRDGRLENKERSVVFLRNLYWTVGAKSDGERYRPGLIIRFRQNASCAVAGDVLSVEGAGSSADTLRARDAEGRTREIPLALADRFEVYEGETRHFAIGDRVRCVERCPLADGGQLSKGSFHTIAGFTATGDIMLDRDRVVRRGYPFLDHGYASTSVSAQGLTVNTVLVAMGATSVPAMSREQFYVSVSRGKREVRLYVDDIAQVREAVRHSSARPSAHDLIEGKIRPDGTRAARLKEWRRRLSRTAEEMARSRGLAVDADLVRSARDEVVAEYHGRVREHAAELGE